MPVVRNLSRKARLASISLLSSLDNGYLLIDGEVVGYYNNGRVYDTKKNVVGYYNNNRLYLGKDSDLLKLLENLPK